MTIRAEKQHVTATEVLTSLLHMRLIDQHEYLNLAELAAGWHHALYSYEVPF